MLHVNVTRMSHEDLQVNFARMEISFETHIQFFMLNSQSLTYTVQKLISHEAIMPMYCLCRQLNIKNINTWYQIVKKVLHCINFIPSTGNTKTTVHIIFSSTLSSIKDGFSTRNGRERMVCERFVAVISCQSYIH